MMKRKYSDDDIIKDNFKKLRGEILSLQITIELITLEDYVKMVYINDPQLYYDSFPIKEYFNYILKKFDKQIAVKVLNALSNINFELLKNIIGIEEYKKFILILIYDCKLMSYCSNCYADIESIYLNNVENGNPIFITYYTPYNTTKSNELYNVLCNKCCPFKFFNKSFSSIYSKKHLNEVMDCDDDINDLFGCFENYPENILYTNQLNKLITIFNTRKIWNNPLYFNDSSNESIYYF